MDYFMSQMIGERIANYASLWIASQNGIVQPFAEPASKRDLFIRRADQGQVGLVISDKDPVYRWIARVPQTPIDFAREMKEKYREGVQVILFTENDFIIPGLENVVDRAMSTNGLLLK